MNNDNLSNDNRNIDNFKIMNGDMLPNFMNL